MFINKRILCYNSAMRLRTKLILTAIIIVTVPVILICGLYYIVTHLELNWVNDLIVNDNGEPMLMTMLTIVVLALVITATALTIWIKAGFFEPIKELHEGLRHIRDGELDYLINFSDKNDVEIAELYRSYEDMRLRLKESADEKLLHEQQNRELISNISHDLKTPITTIRGYAEGLMEGVADTPEKRQKYIRTIFNKANEMNTLINELTLYSSINSDRIPYDFRIINVAEYFASCVEEIGTDLETRGIRINYTNITDENTEIIADAEQLRRVINNIIGNSIKYLGREDESGIVEIRILDEVDSIRVEIEDNGKGIPQKDLPYIFDRFYRADAARTTKTGGSGIGLSIVKKIVEDHSGYIWATSHENEGTCIHIVLRKYRAATSDSEVSEIEIK